MRNRFLRRLPALLGIILVLIGIPLTIYILKNQTGLKSRASDSQSPVDVKITNISDQSFTVTYKTDEAATGSVSYGTNKQLGESGLDDADKIKGAFSPKKIHSISLSELAPATKYYLVIISGPNTFLDDGTPFEVTTGTTIASSSGAEQNMGGKIVLPNGSVPSESLVYLNSENSQLLSATIDNDGKFNIPLKYMRSKDLSSYFNTTTNSVFKLYATDGVLTSNASISLNQAGSIPTITLSNDYDFTQKISPIATSSATSSGFPSLENSGAGLKPAIISPKDNQSVSELKPQFRGTSLPNEKVDIIIHSDEKITTPNTAHTSGHWTYVPTTNLSPGTHTITIKTRDSQGILTTIVQSFIVYAAETAPTIVVPTSTPNPTPTTIIVPSPTIATVIPVITSAPIISSSTKGGLPPTGEPPILLTIGGLVATLFGLALFLSTHKISL